MTEPDTTEPPASKPGEPGHHNTFTIDQRADDDTPRAKLLAQACLKSDLSNARVAKTFAGWPEVGITDLTFAMRERIADVQGGDLARVEAMLFGQADALQAMFSSLAQRGAANMGEYPQAADRYLRLALKAQGQCRATLETLAAIKNPTPPIFAKQANIANGPQQVNNGGQPPALPPGHWHETRACAPAPAPAGQIENRPTELLEHSPCATLPAPAGPMNAEPDRLPASATGAPGKALQARVPT